MSDTMLYVESDSAGVTKRLRDVIQEHANEAIKERNIFKIGLSGTEKIVVVNHRKKYNFNYEINYFRRIISENAGSGITITFNRLDQVALLFL